ncbi:outer membrane protein assembly factor BamD [Desulfosarcina sp. OttesenSCG-928-A07]|nr:outer membrane protein assembly factor BamD [Desulfosarcina sp. OttesenSCG-928-G17]MDL2330090.1 outer membrane protein assembly factor BamD [Desulfosarcina sp. OttesenSCG-928-A07]
MRPFLIVCLCLSFFCSIVSGCAWFEAPREDKTAQELIQDGMDSFSRGHYKTAIASFEKIRDWYPFSRYAILAELKIADAHFNLKSYPDAIFSYEQFEQLHPRNEAIPYVIYQIGRSYFNQMGTPDTDPSNTTMALKTYQRLIRQYPNDAYATNAQSDIITCYHNLSAHEFDIGLFYYKNKNYKAAKRRFLSVITQYPDVGHHHAALNYLANCDLWMSTQDDLPEMISAPATP